MITKETIAHLAQLSRIEVSDKESEGLQSDLESILAYVSEVKTVLGKVLPLSVGEHYNVFREDGEPHETGMHTEALLSQLPRREGAFVKVKKIL